MRLRLESSGHSHPSNLGTRRMLLVHHVAWRLGLSRRMIRHLAKTGKLPGSKAGKKIWQFLVADVEELRARREVRRV
jgi:ribosomal protein S14